MRPSLQDKRERERVLCMEKLQKGPWATPSRIGTPLRIHSFPPLMRKGKYSKSTHLLIGNVTHESVRALLYYLQ